MAFHLSEHLVLADEAGWESGGLDNRGQKPLQGLWEVQPDRPSEGGIIRARREELCQLQ